MLQVAWLQPVAEHAFRVETKDGFGVNGELVASRSAPPAASPA